MVVGVEFDTQSGAVYKPTQYEDKPEWGLVLGTGQGQVLDSGARVEADIVEGDFILFSKYGSQKVHVDGVDFLFVRQEDCISKYVN